MNDLEKESGLCEGDCSACSSNCGGGDIDLDQPTVTLTLDDDTEVTCSVLNIFPIGEQKYISLLPLDENGKNTDGEVYLYRFYTDSHGNPCLENIEEDEEYAAAAEAFQTSMSSIDFRELDDIVEHNS